MYVQRSRSVGFVALSCALALLSGRGALGVEQDSAGSVAAAPCVDDVGVVSPQGQPTARKLAASCKSGYIGDGDCDLDNNTEECGKSEFVIGRGFPCGSLNRVDEGRRGRTELCREKKEARHEP